ncbi:hypothetical protein JHK82_020828 [Glycine max]|nr:hypothetical protein JHK85_021279 [Glycine max]KAG5024928.1 hypothetical protein JHK86_020842 [Glycine max]KAG5136097.1 hypothetical protein JHK82_020828 [Glycine max]KAH1236491.1 putative pentatricopeptide repeat-containing protein [Glycine max]
MCQNNIQSDLYTFCCVFNSIAALKCLKSLRETHGMALKCGFDAMQISATNALADAYAKCDSLEAVENVFNRMQGKDIVSWTTMVTAYCQYSEWGKALAIFSQMRNEGFVPNHFTLSSVITACGGLCLLEYGQQIHGLTCKASMDTETCIESALIDMYAKCGNLKGAMKIFKRISNPDTVSWTAIISTYAQHGLVEDALQLFRKMKQSDAKINAVTLLMHPFRLQPWRKGGGRPENFPSNGGHLWCGARNEESVPIDNGKTELNSGKVLPFQIVTMIVCYVAF